MNRQQKDYAFAKAAHETAREAVKDYEKKWIIAQDIKNPDGTFPTSIYAIDCSEAEFDSLCDALETDSEYMKLCTMENDSFKLLISAEDALIDYALSLPLVPASVRETLNAHRKVYKIRQKLIDSAFRLDTRTVR